MSAPSKSAASSKPTSSTPKEGDTVSILSPVPTQSPNAATPMTSTAATASPPAANAPVTALGAGLLPLPPDVTLPSPPQGYEPTTGINFRGIIPWTAELVILPKVLQDLARFTSYASLLGGTAPPIAQLIQALTAGGEWSAMRGASAAWDAYCRDQEGSAWRLISAMMDRLRPAFALAVKGDASLATTYPSLAELLAVKKVSAQKGVSARQMNKKAKAAGLPANHGAAGKAREKRAAKAALAAATTAAPVAAASPSPQEAATSAAPVTPPAAGTTAKAAAQ